MTDDPTVDQAAAAFRGRLETWIAPLSFEDKTLVLDWVEKSLDRDPNEPDDDDVGMLQLLFDGTAEIAGVKNGEVVFRLSAKGMIEAETLMLHSPDARRVLASLMGATAVDEPKDPQ